MNLERYITNLMIIYAALLGICLSNMNYHYSKIYHPHSICFTFFFWKINMGSINFFIIFFISNMVIWRRIDFLMPYYPQRNRPIVFLFIEAQKKDQRRKEKLTMVRGHGQAFKEIGMLREGEGKLIVRSISLCSLSVGLL